MAGDDNGRRRHAATANRTGAASVVSTDALNGEPPMSGSDGSGAAQQRQHAARSRRRVLAAADLAGSVVAHAQGRHTPDGASIPAP
jgi:hypothetical protein